MLAVLVQYCYIILGGVYAPQGTPTYAYDQLYYIISPVSRL